MISSLTAATQREGPMSLDDSTAHLHPELFPILHVLSKLKSVARSAEVDTTFSGGKGADDDDGADAVGTRVHNAAETDSLFSLVTKLLALPVLHMRVLAARATAALLPADASAPAFHTALLTAPFRWGVLPS